MKNSSTPMMLAFAITALIVVCSFSLLGAKFNVGVKHGETEISLRIDKSTP